MYHIEECVVSVRKANYEWIRAYLIVKLSKEAVDRDL